MPLLATPRDIKAAEREHKAKRIRSKPLTTDIFARVWPKCKPKKTDRAFLSLSTEQQNLPMRNQSAASSQKAAAYVAKEPL